MTTFSYEKSGVNIAAGNSLIDNIKPLANSTKTAGVLSGLGGFAALFAPDLSAYKNPILTAATDGVGTKLRLAINYNKHDGIGIDLVAMCVNDLVVTGSKPLFFLDYYATAKLNIDLATSVVASIANGCKQAGCALIGGETAEMPGMYANTDYDLVGFCVGIVDQSKLIDGKNISSGDVLLGLSSSGVHSNGFSLIRSIIDSNKDSSKINELLTPTKIYIKPILNLLRQIKVKGMAHITGGGLLENIPRILPKNLCAKLDSSAWQLPKIFTYLQQQGNISDTEMRRVFNCGIGMVIIISADDVEKSTQILQKMGEQVYIIGSIITKTNNQQVII